jgi:hypothetical protein
MRACKSNFVLLSTFLLLCTLNAFTQTATGAVNGTVTDPSGAVVTNATVALTNLKTNIVRQAATSGSGFFLFINVQPGDYALKVSREGFKPIDVSNLQVNVNQTLTQNLKLGVGGATETMEVQAQGQLVDSTTTELGTVIQHKVVNDLPLNGRNFTQLLTLAPGVTPVSTSQNKSIGCCEGNVGLPGSGFSDASFHGQENRSKLYFFDGIINTNIRGPTYIVIPNIDLIQEFKVVGHDSKTEFGGATGGVVNMVSSSGTNQFHGSAFEYVRNNFFDARDSFADAKRTGPAPFRQNQFGGTVTGPIVKNKTFFSFGYDGWRFSQPSQALSYVPTAAEIAGDFTGTTKTANQHNLYNPYSTRQVGTSLVRDRFRCDTAGNPLPVDATKQQSQTVGSPCNKIPQALINPAMQKFFQGYSATPNFTGDPSNNFLQGRSTVNNSNSFQIRVDHRFRDSDNVFFRYTEQRVSTLTPIGEVDSTGGGSQGRNYGGGWTHTFGTKLVVDVRAGYAGRPGVDAGQQNQDPKGLDPLKQAGFGDLDKYNGMLVRLATGEWTNGGNNDFGIRGAAPRENPNWSVTPNLSWLKGRHNIKTGFWYIDAKRIQENTYQRYTFADDQTGNPAQSGTTGLSLASALLGFPTSFNGELPVPNGGPVKFKYAEWAAYLQDEWRVRPNITLTYGLRYDYLTQPQTLDGRLWNALDIPNQRWIIGADKMPPLCSVANQAPCIPDAFLADPHFNNVVLAGKQFFAPGPVKDNWGPRAGIAWSVTPRTVVRGGYGLYWDAVPARSQYAQNDLEMAVWPSTTAFAGNVNTTANFAGGGQQLITDIQGHFPTPLPTTNPWTPNSTFGDDPKYKDGYSQQWNVEVQRELSPSMMVSAAYVGSVNGRLPYTGLANAARQASPTGTANSVIDALRPMPWLNANITYAQSIGTSHYNALQTRFQRKFTNGLSSLISYTWSKSTDNGSGYFNVENGAGGGSTVQNYYDPSTAEGLSGYDIAHFFSWATVYELPFGRGKQWLQTGPGAWFLGNWQMNYIFQIRSGQPYNLQVTGDLANLKGGAPNIGNYLRPNIISDPFKAGPVPSNPDPGCAISVSAGGKAPDSVMNATNWFNPCAFSVPSGSFGNLGRDAFRFPHYTNMDLSLFKSIVVKEGWNLQLRFEGFNVFNIQNWSGPSAITVNSGALISKTAGQVTTIQGNPRQLQFGVRFNF